MAACKPPGKRGQGVAQAVSLLPLTLLLSILPTVPALNDNCSSPEAAYGWTCTINPEATTRLDLWNPYDDETITTTAWINATQKVAVQHLDVKFVITVKSWVGAGGNPLYRDETTRALLKQDDPASPEVFVCSSRQFGYWASKGLLSDLTPDLAAWPEWANGDVRPLATVEDLYAPGGVWSAVPFNTDSMILLYNKAAFALKNITNVPFQMTWQQLYDYARRVNNSETGKWGYGLWESNSGSSRILYPLVYNTTGGRVLGDAEGNAKQKCVFDSDNNIAVIEEFLRMWADNVALPFVQACDGGTDLSITNLTDSQGGVAMMLVQPLQLGKVKDPSALGVSILTKAFLGGNGISISSGTPSGSRKASWDIIRELVDPRNPYLSSIASSTRAPPPILMKGEEVGSVAPWNQSGSAAMASFLGVTSGVDYGYPNYSSPYIFQISNSTLFRCMVASIVNDHKPVPDAVHEFCAQLDNIINDFCAPGHNCHHKKASWKLVVILVAVVAFACLMLAVFLFYQRQRCSAAFQDRNPSQTASFKDMVVGQAGPLMFSAKALRTGTNNFSKDNLIGVGGFGEVYRAVMADGSTVAVKKLKQQSEEHQKEFLTEIKIIGTIHHKNLVNLKGYCMANEGMMLVYDFMENGSLEDNIFGARKRKFTWDESFQILMGTAEAICYLHTACQQKIIHRDIKPANILLDNKLMARVADFGMAKDTTDERTHVSTRIMGTLGYLDPSYGHTGQLTEKSDVYSFGMVMLGVLMGRHPLECEEVTVSAASDRQVVCLRDWLQLVGEGSIEVVAERFADCKDFDKEVALQCILVAIVCLQTHPEARPSMVQVVQMLRGEMLVPKLPPKKPEDFVVPQYISLANSSGSRTTTGEASQSQGFTDTSNFPMSGIHDDEVSTIAPR